MNGCGKYEDLIARYIHGQVLLQDKEDLESHISMCCACGELYREIADIDRVLRGMPEKTADPPPHLRSKILANLPEKTGSALWVRWGRWVAALGAAAACIVAATVFYRGTAFRETRVASVPHPAPPAAQTPSEPAPGKPAKPAAEQPPSPAVTAQRTNPPAEKILVVREVKIYLYHPAASMVAVTGDFNGWNPKGVPLSSSGAGVWKTTLRLNPGAYSYNFIVDGNLIVPDPNASEQTPDGFGGTNSILLVRGGNSV
ncbi:MAG: hypothetical protein HY896_08670 [Deltaproteobacteria bacterium]|nr:hypothetical protein [Deltaproteobacteria bacterium]